MKGHTRRAKANSQISLRCSISGWNHTVFRKQKYCADCGTKMKVLGWKIVRREFCFIPAKGEVVNFYVETAKCPVCCEAPAMTKAFSLWNPACRKRWYHIVMQLLLWLAEPCTKNMWIPCFCVVRNRTGNKWGVLLNRATLANWIIYCASQYFAPFYNYLHRQLLKQKFLMAYETGIQILHEEERNHKHIP